MDRSPLGQLLVQWGCIGPDQLACAVQAQKLSHRRLGSILIDGGEITAKQLAQVLSFQLTLPCVTLGNLASAFELRHVVPRALVVAHRLVPTFVRGNAEGPRLLYVATDDPTNDAGLEACAAASGMTVRAMVAAADDVSRALQALHDVPVSSWPAARSATPAARASQPGRPLAPDDDELQPSDEPEEVVEVAFDDEIDFDSDATPGTGPSGKAPTPGRGAPLPPLSQRLTAMPPRAQAHRDRETVPAPAASPPASNGTPATAPPRPLLVLGASPRFVEHVESALDAQEVPVVRVTLVSVRQAARELGPLALLVMEEVYAFDRVALNTLALEVGAALLVWSDDLDLDALRSVLDAAQRRLAPSPESVRRAT